MINFLISADKFTTAVFFLFLGMVSNYITDGIMSCGIQKMIIDSILIKHTIFFILIYFSIGFVDSTTTSPVTIFVSAIFVYVMFMIIMKSQKQYVLAGIIMLGVLYVLQKLKASYEEQNQEEATIKFLENTSLLITIAIFITITIGFFVYIRRQYREHKDTFTLSKFFFGTNKCESVKR